jgi:hypothetical protein
MVDCIQSFVRYRNIDQYLEKLRDNHLSQAARDTVMSLLIEEIDKIGFGQEQFTRIELWLIDCKKHIAKISRNEISNSKAERTRQSVLATLQEL